LIHSLVWCGLPSTLNHFPLLSIRTSYVSWSPCFVAFLLLQSRGLLISQGVFFSFPFFFLFFLWLGSGTTVCFHHRHRTTRYHLSHHRSIISSRQLGINRLFPRWLTSTSARKSWMRLQL
jgi:hypothetical protein